MRACVRAFPASRDKKSLRVWGYSSCFLFLVSLDAKTRESLHDMALHLRRQHGVYTGRVVYIV